MNSRVDLAIAIPQTFPGRPVDVQLIRQHLQRAEALGYHSAWVVEQILGSIPSLEPVELLTWAAAVTERIRLGAAVLLTALRSPVHLAKSLATLDHLSDGRLMVGVGLGGNPAVYPAFGLTPERRAARFAEGVRLIKRLWTEPRTTFEGEFWKLRNASMEPKPLQKPHPPIWFGAHHPNALRRAVEVGTGFMGAGSLSTSKFAEEVKLLRDLVRDAGRDPGTFPVGKRVYIALDRDRQRAAKRLSEWFGAFYGRPQMAEEVSVWGPADECVERLREVVAAGAGLVMLNPVFDEMEHLEELASIAPRI
ncbi:MAG: LLM class F420-dependent oxidoreductase [Candidatus Rokuibacteriota bacterium]|nr:MAG: LLM class F420-dependent oxidoreductase [Candidatus Rokubacteria bacterium]